MRRRTVLLAGASGAATLAGCLSVPVSNRSETEIQDVTFDVTSVQCGNDPESYTVKRTPAENRAVVTGTLRGADTCATARFEGYDYDETADALTLRVQRVTEVGTGQACAQCLVNVEYRIDVVVSGEIPETIGVEVGGPE
jgi:hypothetical protein